MRLHVYPIDPSLTDVEAWAEWVRYGQRVTFTGKPKWAVIDPAKMPPVSFKK